MLMNKLSFALVVVLVLGTSIVSAQAPIPQTVHKPVVSDQVQPNRVIAATAIQGIPAGAVIVGLPAGAVIRDGQIIIGGATEITSNATPVIQAGAQVVAQPQAANTAGLSSLEADIVAQTNAARARSGLAPLQVDQGLMNGARAHANWMARSNVLQHGSAAVAENIATGQSGAAEVVNDWMNSPGHRANLLGRYSSIGVAAYTSSSGRVYWCQQFR